MRKFRKDSSRGCDDFAGLESPPSGLEKSEGRESGVFAGSEKTAGCAGDDFAGSEHPRPDLVPLAGLVSPNLVPPEQYPLSLGNSIYKPKALYARGDLSKFVGCANAAGDAELSRDAGMGSAGAGGAGLVGIAMVGTRRPSSNAAELCRRLVFGLQGTRAVVVSGLAQGIDSLCHEAALEAGIPTIAVLGQGLGTRIEGSRGELARRILEAGGALLSTFPPDTPAYKGNFVARNKIISGLCSATVVVQSKAQGGALLTAENCIKEGKPLFAIPGEFDSEVAQGTNALLDSGTAKPIFKPESISMVLGLPHSGGNSVQTLRQVGCSLSPQTQKFFDCVNGFRKTFPELQSEFGFNVPTLLAILTELEIAGLAHTEDNFQFYFNGAP